MCLWSFAPPYLRVRRIFGPHQDVAIVHPGHLQIPGELAHPAIHQLEHRELHAGDLGIRESIEILEHGGAMFGGKVAGDDPEDIVARDLWDRLVLHWRM